MSKFVDIDGIFLLNKPTGMTSNAALQKVKHRFRAKKAGHTGSLDPLATGMLPICFGQATKFAQFFIDDDKCYTVVATLGASTNSGDSTGEVTQEMPVPPLTPEAIESALSTFIGATKQIPPMFSAIKINGKRLYKLAHKGKEIERPARDIKISQIEMIGDMGLNEAGLPLMKLQVSCSKGTYIRVLVEDIAKALGTCAHVSLLHRNYVGKFKSEQIISLEQLEILESNGDYESMMSHLLPVSTALPSWPKVQLNQVEALSFMQGRRVPQAGLAIQDWIRVYSEQGEFVGLGTVDTPNMVKPKRLLNTKHIENISVSQ